LKKNITKLAKLKLNNKINWQKTNNLLKKFMQNYSSSINQNLINSQKIVLCILDGWGIGNDANPNNAIAQANLQFYPQILAQYPHSQLETSGLAVGLPQGQIGNSEVGHITIGAGRVIFQDLPKINQAIENGSLANNQIISNLIKNFANQNKVCHLMGLVSNGGVHSHIDHLLFLANFLSKNGVKIQLHCFLDGRDVAQKSALQYLEQIKQFPIATISGRYYAMDRDNKWDRIQLAYNCIIFGNQSEKNATFSNIQNFINSSYQNNITDEFILPSTNQNYGGMQDGDGLIFVNFRADRARQISSAILDENFTHFQRKKISLKTAIAMTEYSAELNQHFQTLFPPENIQNSLPQILEKLGKTQLRIAETEKYAHVSFFFSCGQEEKFIGEDRILVASPQVKTYDLKPEMSAIEVQEKLVEAINGQKYNLIVVNFANPDMVGHSGLLEPSIKACQSIDKQLQLIVAAVLQNDYHLIITADHGNIELMQDENKNPHTSHTTNPVPFILIGNNLAKIKLRNGTLADIAPTILHLMNIEKPIEMKGCSLIE